MKEIDFLKAMDWTSPQPLAAVCTLKHDGKIGNALLYCGKVSGREVDKAAKCKIELVKVEGSQIKVPAETKIAAAAMK